MSPKCWLIISFDNLFNWRCSLVAFSLLETRDKVGSTSSVHTKPLCGGGEVWWMLHMSLGHFGHVNPCPSCFLSEDELTFICVQVTVHTGATMRTRGAPYVLRPFLGMLIPVHSGAAVRTGVVAVRHVLAILRKGNIFRGSIWQPKLFYKRMGLELRHIIIFNNT